MPKGVSCQNATKYLLLVDPARELFFDLILELESEPLRPPAMPNKLCDIELVLPVFYFLVLSIKEFPNILSISLLVKLIDLC